MDVTELFNLLLELFKNSGYPLIFLITLLETTVFIGMVIPGEIAILLASFLASKGDFNLFSVILIGIIGNVIGNNLSYFLGKRGGRLFLEKYGRYFFISPGRIKAAENYFGKHGSKTVFYGRFVAVAKAFTSALAGASKMSYPRFLFYSSLAVVLWVGAFGVLGFFFGVNWKLILKIINAIGWVFLLILVAVGLIVYFRARRKRLKKWSING